MPTIKSHIPDDVLEYAKTFLSPQQLRAWQGEARGWTTTEIMFDMLIAKSTVIDYINAAHMKLLRAGIRMDLGTGAYYRLEETNGPLPQIPSPPASSNGREQHP